MNGKATGRSRIVHSNGDAYEGQWENDKANGLGVYYHYDNIKYDGQWKDDEKVISGEMHR